MHTTPLTTLLALPLSAPLCVGPAPFHTFSSKHRIVCLFHTPTAVFPMGFLRMPPLEDVHCGQEGATKRGKGGLPWKRRPPIGRQRTKGGHPSRGHARPSPSHLRDIRTPSRMRL